MRNAAAFVVCGVIAGAAVAQVADSLPAALSGRWTATGPTGVFVDSFSIVFEGTRAPGTVPGRLNWRGVSCGAKDEPIQASWDGVELRFEAVLKSDTNTQRAGGRCPSEAWRWVLKRKPGERTFEGEARNPAAAALTVTVTAAP